MPDTHQIKISVALCTYNGEAFIEAQLDSILKQSLAVDEIIICDDQSTDATISILKKYASLYPNIIKLYENKTKHYTVKNFEKAISFTSGFFIFLSDQDDIWEPEKVQRSVSYLNTHKDCIMLFTNASLIDKNSVKTEGTLWSNWNFDSEIQEQWKSSEFQIISLIQNINKVTGATVVFKSTLKKDILPINVPRGVWHDCFMALNAARHDGLHFLDEKLIQYRIHDNQQVGLGGENSSYNNEAYSYKAYRNYLKNNFKSYLSYYDSKYADLKKNKSNKTKFMSRLNAFFKIFKKIVSTFKT